MHSLKNYPKRVGSERHYARVPKEIDGKWYMVNLLVPAGFSPISYSPYDTMEDCTVACNVQNGLKGFSPEFVEKLLQHQKDHQHLPFRKCTMCQTNFAQKNKNHVRCPMCGAYFTTPMQGQMGAAKAVVALSLF
jgi:ribosomal protein S27E